MGSPRDGATRRQFLLGGAAAGVGAAVGLGGAGLAAALAPASAEDPAEPELHGRNTVPFHGAHQAGIATDAQAHLLLLALDLRDDVDRDALGRMMRTLSDDAARLTQGRPALADTEPELAPEPANLTVTFGFGPGLVARADRRAPDWLGPLPAFGIDDLRAEYSDGDLLIQVCADDPLTAAHAARMLLKDARTFATVRWRQQGFRRAHGTVAPGTTMRNLFGQVDGTSNPVPGTEEFDRTVWIREGWLAGGTGLVVRRIHMDLDGWDRIDRPGRELSVGRTMLDGAPLTGGSEHDEPDLEAVNELGFPVIPAYAHLRRARGEGADGGERIFRRAYNDEVSPAKGEISEAALVFLSFQADVAAQFVPIQRRLDELDLLNTWTTPIGSAVFAVPPGCAEGGWVGETLLA